MITPLISLKKLRRGHSAALFFLIFSFFLPFQASATTPSSALLLTWKTNTLVPSSYSGKALPSAGATIEVSATLFRNSSFSIPAGSQLIWIINGEQRPEFRGRASILFPVDSYEREQTIIARLDTLTSTLTIPLREPEAVIFPPQSLLSSAFASLRALPYYFLVTTLEDLLFTWSANGIEASSDDEPQLFDIDASTLPGGSDLRVDLTISAPRGGQSANAIKLFRLP